MEIHLVKSSAQSDKNGKIILIETICGLKIPMDQLAFTTTDTKGVTCIICKQKHVEGKY